MGGFGGWFHSCLFATEQGLVERSQRRKAGGGFVKSIKFRTSENCSKFHSQGIPPGIIVANTYTNGDG